MEVWGCVKTDTEMIAAATATGVREKWVCGAWKLATT